jgi:hypothetical protein
MDNDRSRRNFLAIISGTALTFVAARVVGAQNQNGNSNPIMHGGTSGPNYGQGNTMHSGNGSGGGVNASAGSTGPAGPQPPSAQDAGGITPPKTGGKNAPPTELNDKLRSDARDIRAQVNQLAQQVAQLKAEVEKTDATRVLSLDVIRKTKDIEKLAHYIASLEKG